MIERARLLLKSKYGLVHVPSVHKTRRWIAEARRHIDGGEPSEQAGIAAARSVFPYEFKPYNIHSAAPVQEIIELESPE